MRLPGSAADALDYTAAMLHMAVQFRNAHPTTGFKLGGGVFSSTAALFQTFALLQNVGHLPGTFAVEKGVLRFLRREDGRLESLPWPDRVTEAQRAQLFEQLEQFLDAADYNGMSRVVGLLKLLIGLGPKQEVRVPPWVTMLYAAWFLPDLRLEEEQDRWAAAELEFSWIRRLAYLNQDTALVATPTTVSVAPLLARAASDPLGVGDAMRHSREVLRAFEHTIYEGFYHHPRARAVAAVAAHLTEARLREAPHWQDELLKWAYSASLDDVVLDGGIARLSGETRPVMSISLRGRFASLDVPLVEAEHELIDALSRRRDYEMATIAHKLYEATSVPSASVLAKDLEALLGAYDDYLQGH